MQSPNKLTNKFSKERLGTEAFGWDFIHDHVGFGLVARETKTNELILVYNGDFTPNLQTMVWFRKIPARFQVGVRSALAKIKPNFKYEKPDPAVITQFTEAMQDQVFQALANGTLTRDGWNS